MKQFSSYTLLLCLLFTLFAGCRKDEGNYHYNNINELSINNIPDEYQVRFGTKADLKPALSFTKDSADGHFTYEWMVIDPAVTSAAKLRVLHTGKNLDVEMKLAEGRYDTYFTVRETATGITWQKKFTLNITGAFFKKGWAVLSEMKGATNLQFLEEDMTALGTYPKRYPDLVSLITDRTTNTPLELKGKPRFIHVFSNHIPAVEPTSKVWLYVGTTETCEKLNITNGFLWKAVTYQFKQETAINYPTVPDWVHSPTSGAGYAYYNGELFKSYAPQREIFGVPISKMNTGELYYIEPYMAIPMNSHLMSLVYDRDNKRFLKHGGSLVNFLAELPANPNGFDPNNLNMNLVWMGHTSAFGGQAVAILKNAGGQFYLARMQFTAAGAFSATSLTEITIPELKAGEKFAMERRYGYLMYSVGGKLYQYDMDVKSNILVKDYGNNAKITLIKSGLNALLPRWIDVENFPASYNKVQLAPPVLGVCVGVYEPTNPDASGKLEVFDLTGATPRSYYQLSGFGKIADVDYLNF